MATFEEHCNPKNNDNTVLRNMKESKVSPSFLHSNSTSHTSCFTAIAELIDNAYDPDVQAKELHIDQILLNGTTCLTFTDDGSGLNPEELHRMLSFGFCQKVTINGHRPIGHYGNGFKSGSMRLGKDVLVLTKKQDIMSVGFLSQTFLKATKAMTVVIPMLSWNMITRKQISSENVSDNVQSIVKYSPLKSPHDIMRQFQEIPKRGTRIIIYNLKSIDGRMELDFISDPYDIIDSAVSQTSGIQKIIENDYIPGYKKSLKNFCSILYLKPRMKIILRTKKVSTKLLAKSMSKTEKDVYKPYFLDKPVAITFGFSGNQKDYGICFYHRNRLIKAMERVGIQRQDNELGVGVIGVIEADFLTPIHNKTDFQIDVRYNSTINALASKLNDYWREKTQDKAAGSVMIQSQIPDTDWLQCDACLKWRKLPKNSKKMPDKFFCYLNPDPEHNNCEFPEEVDDEEIKSASYVKSFKKRDRQKRYSMEKLIREKNDELIRIKTEMGSSDEIQSMVNELSELKEKLKQKEREELSNNSSFNDQAMTSKRQINDEAVLNKRIRKSNEAVNEPIVQNERFVTKKENEVDDENYRKQLFSLRRDLQYIWPHIIPGVEIPKRLTDVDEFIKLIKNNLEEKQNKILPSQNSDSVSIKKEIV